MFQKFYLNYFRKGYIHPAPNVVSLYYILFSNDWRRSIDLKKNYKFWFCTGSQDLYGDECLANVAEHSKKIVSALNE